MKPWQGRDIRSIKRILFKKFGPQHWWPGETPFEVMVGAILTQNTAWTNASRAIDRLKEGRLLSPVKLDKVSQPRLARLIRSSGYFNQKSKRLKEFVHYFRKEYGGSVRRMRRRPAAHLRAELLELSGIGPETADSILLYALGKPVFVVDAYTRRVLARHSLIPWGASYAEIQALFNRNLPPSRASLFNEYHALLVRVGKEFCRARPKCQLCPLRRVGRLRLESHLKPNF